jgi:hypothetical protein
MPRRLHQAFATALLRDLTPSIAMHQELHEWRKALVTSLSDKACVEMVE